jgi:hypothetical protein
MSDMTWHALLAPPSGTKTSDDEVYYGMPLVVSTDYKAKTTVITVPGQWNGSVDKDGISMSTNLKVSPGNTVITFGFTGPAPSSVSTSLTSTSDPSVGCSVGIKFRG